MHVGLCERQCFCFSDFWFTFFVKLNVTIFDEVLFQSQRFLVINCHDIPYIANRIEYFYYSGEARGLVSVCDALVVYRYHFAERKSW